MRIYAPNATLDQIVGGTLNAGVIPWARLDLISAIRSRAYFEEDFEGGSTTSGSIGRLGWSTISTATGSIAGGLMANGDPGAYLLQTGATSGSFITLFCGPAGLSFFKANMLFDIAFSFLASASDNSLGFDVGMADQTNTLDPSEGIYLQKKTGDTNYFFVCRNGGVETRTDSGVAADTNIHTIRIRQTSVGTIGFSLDGGAFVNIASNVPSTGLQLNVVLTNAVAANKVIYMDAVIGSVSVTR